MLNFICGGLLGDFIQCLFVIKNVCQIYDKKANLYITDDISFGGDQFKFSIQQTYDDLSPIIQQQDYINDFKIYDSTQNIKEFINLNHFRFSPKLYHACWSNFLESTFNFKAIKPYQWVTINKVLPEYLDKIIIHRSLKRHNQQFPWDKIIDKYKDNIIFITNNIDEYNNFPYKGLPVIETKNLLEQYEIINSSKMFIGNQSAPFAIASSLDKPRYVELHEGIDRFSYIGEENYSNNYLLNIL